MRLFTFLGALLVLQGAFAQNNGKGSRHLPEIIAVRGKAEVKVARNENFQPAKTNVRLQEQAVFRTGSDGSLRIRLVDGLILELQPESQIKFPGISWDNGAVPVVELEEGHLRWIEKTDSSTRVTSSLFEINPPVGEFIFVLRPGMAQAGVMVLEKEISFRALNGETSYSVPKGKKIFFQGVIEEGEIAYDILLQNRKIPRGVMGKLQDLTAQDLAPYRAEQEKLKKAQEAAEEAQRQKLARDRKAGLICKNPSGVLNQCAWVCEKNPAGSKVCRTDLSQVKCVRRRCNTNGEWADPSELKAEEGRHRCQVQPQVAACDY